MNRFHVRNVPCPLFVKLGNVTLPLLFRDVLSVLMMSRAVEYCSLFAFFFFKSEICYMVINNTRKLLIKYLQDYKLLIRTLDQRQ